MAECLLRTIVDLSHQNARRISRADVGINGMRSRDSYFRVNGIRMFVGQHVLPCIKKALEEVEASDFAVYEQEETRNAKEVAAEVTSTLSSAVEGLRGKDGHRQDFTPEDNRAFDETVSKVLEDAKAKLSAIVSKQKQRDKMSTTKAACAGCSDGAMQDSMMKLHVTVLGGLELEVRYLPVSTIQDLKLTLEKAAGVRARDQKLAMCDEIINTDKPHVCLGDLGLKDGSQLTLVAVAHCLVCLGPCQCEACHGEGRYDSGCAVCGKIRPACEECGGPCKCSDCHGTWRHCPQCAAYFPCWGGDTRVFQPDGGSKKVRDCSVGDEVRTLLGFRKIAKIWFSDPEKPDLNKEVCCINGVWITAKHPIICGDHWVNPCELKDVATAPWRKRRHMMPDMFTFELEGHDDTIVLGGASNQFLVSCTLGKYLGPHFGYDVWTRRSTRCAKPCVQCDSVYIPGARFDSGMDPTMRKKVFPAFTQVEWSKAKASEFELASELLGRQPVVQHSSKNLVE